MNCGDPVPAGQIHADPIRGRRHLYHAPGRAFEDVHFAMNVPKHDNFCHDRFLPLFGYNSSVLATEKSERPFALSAAIGAMPY